MPAAKRRKVIPAVSTVNISSAKTITAFTKVSKAQATSKSVYDKVDCSLPIQFVKQLDGDKKRKLRPVEIEVDLAANKSSEIHQAAIGPAQRNLKHLPRRSSTYSQKLLETPRKSTLPSLLGATQKETPTNGARGLLDNLTLSPPLSGTLRSSSSRSQDAAIRGIYSSSYESAAELEALESENTNLPIELLNLINLHSSFLTALSLYYAHNGTHSPADLHVLCSNISKVWGKRKVILEDIRRTLGVLYSDIIEDNSRYSKPLTRLSLSDYGHGKICIETRDVIGKGEKAWALLDENHLNSTFAINLQKLWEHKGKGEGTTVSIFISGLPLEPITTCSSLIKISPLLAKGQQRLEDLKAGILSKKQAENERTTRVLFIDEQGRKPSLLERLKAKELRQSVLPAPPSKIELSRRAALHRLEEVVSVLCLLTTSTSIGQQRVSFTMPTVLGKLKDSFKTPLSREEAETCIRLLASEVAPEWLRVVKMGKTYAVVVNRNNRPSDLDIKERVRRTIG